MQWHSHQEWIDGTSYIGHPLRVLNEVMKCTDDKDTLITSVLHDCFGKGTCPYINLIFDIWGLPIGVEDSTKKIIMFPSRGINTIIEESDIHNNELFYVDEYNGWTLKKDNWDEPLLKEVIWGWSDKFDFKDGDVIEALLEYSTRGSFIVWEGRHSYIYVIAGKGNRIKSSSSLLKDLYVGDLEVGKVYNLDSNTNTLTPGSMEFHDEYKTFNYESLDSLKPCLI